MRLINNRLREGKLWGKWRGEDRNKKGREEVWEDSSKELKDNKGFLYLYNKLIPCYCLSFIIFIADLKLNILISHLRALLLVLTKV